MPTASYRKEQSSQGRVSSLLVFKTYKTLPQTLYLPEIYAESLNYLYSVYDFGHRFLPAHSPLPTGQTRGQTEVFVDAGVARFTLLELGTDLDAYLLEQEKAALSQGVGVLQIYLNLASPSVGAAIEVLRQHQYFLGGILPRWFDSDGLLMQKITHSPWFEDVRLYSERTKKNLAILVADRQSVLNLTQGGV